MALNGSAVPHNKSEEMMKLHLVYVTGLAIMLIEPAWAQRNPDVEQALSQSVGKIFVESCKKGDAVYMASRYTDNALVLPPGPPVIGRQAIEKSWDAAFMATGWMFMSFRVTPGSFGCRATT
jgi:hypothetical protein